MKKDVIVSIDQLNLQALFSMSDFCVILPGDTSSSSKLYRAIFQGCIPVVFVSFYDQLPFSHFIDWSLFSVVLLKDVIYFEAALIELLQYLRLIRQNRSLLFQFKRNLDVASSLFDAEVNTWPSLYHLTILQLVEDLDAILPQKRMIQKRCTDP